MSNDLHTPKRKVEAKRLKLLTLISMERNSGTGIAPQWPTPHPGAKMDRVVWKEVLELFYDFDAREVRPCGSPESNGGLDCVSHENDRTGMTLNVCARLHLLGYESHVADLWAALAYEEGGSRRPGNARSLHSPTGEETGSDSPHSVSNGSISGREAIERGVKVKGEPTPYTCCNGRAALRRCPH